MARKSTIFLPLTAALLAAAMPAAASEPPPLAELDISLSALADRADLGDLSGLLGFRAASEAVEPAIAADPPARPGAAREESRSVDRPAENSVPISIDEGERLGCRIGSVVPYARLDLRTLAARNGALVRRVAGRSDVPFRALGLRLDLDPRTVLRLEAFLGPPDFAHARDPGAGDERAVGFAVQIVFAF